MIATEKLDTEDVRNMKDGFVRLNEACMKERGRVNDMIKKMQ